MLGGEKIAVLMAGASYLDSLGGTDFDWAYTTVEQVSRDVAMWRGVSSLRAERRRREDERMAKRKGSWRIGIDKRSLLGPRRSARL